MIKLLRESNDKIALKEISDSWNMIDKYNIDYDYKSGSNVIYISKADYQKMLNASKNKAYIKNLCKNVKESLKKWSVDIYVDNEFDKTKYFSDKKTASKWVDQFNYDSEIGTYATNPELVNTNESIDYDEADPKYVHTEDEMDDFLYEVASEISPDASEEDWSDSAEEFYDKCYNAGLIKRHDIDNSTGVALSYYYDADEVKSFLMKGKN